MIVDVHALSSRNHQTISTVTQNQWWIWPLPLLEWRHVPRSGAVAGSTISWDNECSNLQVWLQQNHQSTNQVKSQWNTLLHFTNKSHSERRRSAFLCPPEAHRLSLVASMALCHLNLLVLGGYSSHLIITISSSNDFSTQQRWLNKTKSKVSFQFVFGNSSFSHSFHSKYCRFWIEHWLHMVPQQDAPCFLLLIQSVTKPCKTAMVLQAARRNWFKLNAASFKLPLVLVNHSNHIRWLIYFKKFSFQMTNTSDKSHHLNVDPQPFLASTQAKCPKTISQASTIVSVSSRKNPCQHAYDLNTLVITETSSSCNCNLCACWFNQPHPNHATLSTYDICVMWLAHDIIFSKSLSLGKTSNGVESLGSFPNQGTTSCNEEHQPMPSPHQAMTSQWTL